MAAPRHPRAQGPIGIDSPLVHALLKKTVDDEAVVELSKDWPVYAILEISYKPFDKQSEINI